MKKLLLTLMTVAAVSSFAIAQEEPAPQDRVVVLTEELLALEEKAKNPETPLTEVEEARRLELEEEIDRLNTDVATEEA